MFTQCIVYMASIHAAWEADTSTHQRVAAASAFLQCTREKLTSLKTTEPHPSAKIVTLVIDVVTDARHIHLVEEAGHDGGFGEEVDELLAYPEISDANMEELRDLAKSLARVRSKDPVPHSYVAACIKPLAEKCAASDKELHIILTGCNTINVCPQLKELVPEPCQSSVWVLCTSTKWPGDIAVFLWHLYASTVQFNDMQTFRQRTRTLLGEYTGHFQRQRIEDVSSQEEARVMHNSLAEAVHLERLDRIRVAPSGHAEVPLL